MPPTQAALERLLGALELDTPRVALYDAAPSPAFGKLVEARGRACCFAYYPRWVKGETLVVRRADDDFGKPSHGCPGLQRSLGLGGPYPPWMANFLTDGKNGAPMGEGLKASPALAQEYLDRARRLTPSGDSLLLGPLRLEAWPAVRSVTFFADADRLSALMTLAAYWSAEPDEVIAPFSSGCGLLWRELVLGGRERAVLGCTDVAMRKYLPRELMSLTVGPERLERMLGYPDDAFLGRSWWRELLEARTKRHPPADPA
ncbi:MAG TPA: DUF169 domain-containing protein [Myxococcota bacterium]|nr:DUF169 domain-containing protein [Myxococcota bacterium]HRY96225.1 DUF169 domain-containing protein [Myxococcota bacterium]HSA23558.1 DUF169 domain-containing protein [Myxococcota bacterium]